MECTRTGSAPAFASACRIFRAAALLPLPGAPRSSTTMRDGRPPRPGSRKSSAAAATAGAAGCCCCGVALQVCQTRDSCRDEMNFMSN